MWKLYARITIDSWAGQTICRSALTLCTVRSTRNETAWHFFQRDLLF